MSKNVHQKSDEFYEYLNNHSIRKPESLDALLNETQNTPNPMMATTHEQGQLLSFLIKSIGAKRAIEVGTFTGVGALWMAEALGVDGHLVACEVKQEFIDIAQSHWEKAGVDKNIEVRLAPALETLDALLDEGQAGSYDFCYIDAVKLEYDQYYEKCLQLIRSGGIIALDNMFLGGNVLKKESKGPPAIAISSLNSKLKDDDRVDNSMLSIGDGLHLARKR